ncbi:MAG: glycosyltransferase [Chthoniobacteraceae bacterium]|jgi:glycosyltransferase involved in cell wall biosynthesis
MPLSLLHLIDSLDPAAGGPVEFLSSLSRQLAVMGHKSSAALLTWPDHPAPDSLEILYAARKQSFGGYGFHTGLVAWLRAESRRHDAIFVHGLWQYHGAAAWLALSSRDTPYYVFPHGMLDPWFAADRARHFKKHLYWHAVEKRILHRSRALLFTSEQEMSRAPLTFGAPWRAAHLMPLGIPDPPPDADTQRESFLRRFPQFRNRRILLFLGRIDRKKGCDLLARAFASLQPQGWDLVFAGPCADPAFLAELPGAHFTGMLQGPEKWGAFRCAEVFALPSHQENFALAMAEALACGLPVLLSTAVDTHATVTASGAGFAEPDTLDGARRLIERWLALVPSERDQMKLAAHHCFRAHFHIRECAARLLSLLEGGRRLSDVSR